jgi:hypothetical protein
MFGKDANCFWRAISYLVSNDENNYMLFKECVTEFLIEN